jgi:hypothetical protein
VDASLTRRLTPDTSSLLYPAADEIADFGAPQEALAIRIAQLSAAVGPGHFAEASLTIA